MASCTVSSAIQFKGEAMIETSHFSKPSGAGTEAEGWSHDGGGREKRLRMERRVEAVGFEYNRGKSRSVYAVSCALQTVSRKALRVARLI
jgi:hypothetical protein